MKACNGLKKMLFRKKWQGVCRAGMACFLLCSFFCVTAFAKTVTLSWSPSKSANVGGYRLYYGQASRSYTVSKDVGKATSYKLTGLPNTAVFYFSLKAYNVKRTQESSFSNEVSSKGKQTAASTVAVDGLVAAYGFEEGRGPKAMDASGNANNGKIKRAIRTRGRFGKAIYLDGKNWVTVKDSVSLDLTGAFTLEAWVKPKAIRRSSIIYKQKAKGSSYDLYAYHDTDLPVSSFNDGAGYSVVSGVNQLPVKGWSHLAASFDGAVQRLYLNGAEVSSVRAQKTAIQPSDDVLRIGGNGVSGDYFRGTIDEVRIYNRALTLEEIQADLGAAIIQRQRKK